MTRRPAISLPLWLVLLPAFQEAGPGSSPEAGFESITEADLRAHVSELAAPQLEGRDSPSDGLTRAGDYIIARLQAAGVEPGMPGGGFRHPYSVERTAPVPEECLLALDTDDGPEQVFVLEQDYVPLPSCPGEGAGPLSFYGFGITETRERYDDLKGKNCKGEVVMILEGEPRHKRLFEGPEITEASDVYAKIKNLEDRGARAVLVVRRPPEEEFEGLDGKPVGPTPLGYRYTWALWNHEGKQPTQNGNFKIPALEITPEVASKLLGTDVLELAAGMDRSGKPTRREPKGVEVTVRAGLRRQGVPIDNIVGLVRGTDPELSKEYVVLGAHYDHIGVDGWGRIGCGADDNASGSAGLVELAQAFALSPPARSVLLVWFSAEEDGLVGSEAFADQPPVPLASMAAMLNMDMIGRCDEYEVCVLGPELNPVLEDALKQAKKLRPCGLKKIVTGKGQEFWERSDQASFASKGVPSMFFFEGAIEADNPDYHTYRDTVDRLSIPKMTRITRLVFNTAWVIANLPRRPPPSR